MKDFMSFVDGTSRSSAPNDQDEGNGADYLNTLLDRWGDRRVPRRDDDRDDYREMTKAPRPGYPFS